MAIESYHARLRALLRAHPDGLAVDTLAMKLKAHRSSIYNSLKSMPDAYVASWRRTAAGRQEALWAVVEVPDDAPQAV